MNLRSTVALLLLAACGLTAWVASGTFRDPTSLLPRPDAGIVPPDKPLLGERSSFREVVIERGKEKATLARAADGTWRMAGNWPMRSGEADRLLDALGGLRSRFAPEKNPDWAKRGLDKPAVKVTVKDADGKSHALELADDPSGSGTRFDRPTYARLDGGDSAYRLAPGLVALLDRPADFYLQRRLLPVKRLKKDEGMGYVDRLDGQAFAVEEKGERKYALRSRAGEWELEYPLRDALDPKTRDAVLEAAAELWAESFVDAPKGFAVERVFTLTRADGSETVLEIGPPVPGDEVGKAPRNYARLKGQDRYFEIALAKMPALVPPLDQLRETQLARFKADDAREVTITTGKGEVVLRNEAKPKAAGEDGPPPPADWRVTSPIKAKADSAAVDKLISTLSGLNATDRDAGTKIPLGAAVASLAGPLVAGFAANKGEVLLGTAKPSAAVTVKVGEGDKERMFTVRLGRHDAVGKKLYATSGGWPRVNEVGDDLAGLLVGKGVLDFRGKKLLELFPSDVEKVTVSSVDLSGLGALFPAPLALPAFLAAAKSETTALERAKDGWVLTSPVKSNADEGRADDLAGKLAGLEVAAFVVDRADAKTLQSAYGLGLPRWRAVFSFRDKAKPARTLLVGKERPEGGWYAKLEDEPEVFAIAKDLHDAVARGSLAYRPSQLWAVAPGDEAAEFTIRRAGTPEYKLARKGDGWEVSGPFTVAAPREAGEKIAAALAAPKAERYEAHAGDAAAYGLTAPTVSVTMKTKKGATHSLSIGKERFARVDTEAAVFVVGDELAKALDQSPLDFLDKALFAFDAAGATRFVRQDGADVLEIVKKDEAWEIVKPTPGPADEKKVPDLLRLFSMLKAERFVAFDPKNLKDFGLGAPAMVRVSLGGDKADEKVLQVGSALPDGSRHAQVAGSKAVAVIAKADAARLLAGPLAFRDHLVARLQDADEARLDAGERKAVFAKPEGTWKLTKPIEADADHDAMEAFFNGLARLRADEFVSDKPAPADVAKYGLDKPEASWRFVLSGKEALVLDMGKAEPDGARRYARLKGKDAVFLLDAKLSAQAVAEYRPRTVFKTEIDPATVEGVKYGYATGAFELKKADGKWEFAGKEAADQKVNVAALTDALSVLRGLKLERYAIDTGAELKLFGLDPVELTLEVTTPTGKQTLLVGGTVAGSKRRYAKQPGKDGAVFVLDEAASVKLVRTKAELTAK